MYRDGASASSRMVWDNCRNYQVASNIMFHN